MTRTGQHQRCISAIPWLQASGALALGAIFVSAVIGIPSAQAQTYTYQVLYSFTGGADGGVPVASLIRGPAGNVYGTTEFGGASGDGVVFQLDTTGTETVLHSFTGGTDGGMPRAGLIGDAAGNLYGTTELGGASGGGVVFKVDKTGETVLYSFAGKAGSGSPRGRLIRDSAGNIYGTTRDGGVGAGVVFKLDTAGTETVLYGFTGGADGGNPVTDLIRDSTGNLYGTTTVGGKFSFGVVFKVDTTGTETVLHSFTGLAGGGGPHGGLIRDSVGNLYGTTYGGGASGYGVVFKLDTAGTETVLHSFTGGTDGAAPLAGLIGDSAGHLYGTTNFGGTSNSGVVFRLDKTGETVLYSFTGGADGGNPAAGLIQDSAGNLYGTTSDGGASANSCDGYPGCGVVFKLTRAAE